MMKTYSIRSYVLPDEPVMIWVDAPDPRSALANMLIATHYLAVGFDASTLGRIQAKNIAEARKIAYTRWGILVCYVEKEKKEHWIKV